MTIENEMMNRLEDKMNNSTTEEIMNISNLATIQKGSNGVTDVMGDCHSTAEISENMLN